MIYNSLIVYEFSKFLQEGVILGADTRATGGSIVADLNCEKIHYIADNIYCCGAGTAADTEFTTKYVNITTYQGIESGIFPTKYAMYLTRE